MSRVSENASGLQILESFFCHKPGLKPAPVALKLLIAITGPKDLPLPVSNIS